MRALMLPLLVPRLAPAFALGTGYLLGSVPNAIWVCRLFNVDITKVGSGNPGMTNVWRTLGWKPALPVAILDAAKGFFAAWFGFLWTHSILWSLLAGLAAVLGHSFSLFVGFKGGKSVLTGFGVFLYLSPVASLSCLALWGIVLALSRYVSLASLSAAFMLPLCILLEAHWHGATGTTAVFWTALVICLFVIFRHRTNISRLLQGTESRFQGKAT
jgi:glycerol-3-phosphate acyltransferase PlsY